MRPVRFNIHPKEAEIADAIGMGKAPDGVTGDGFFATQLSSVVGLARKNSLWPLPFHGHHGIALRLISFWIGACGFLSTSV